MSSLKDMPNEIVETYAGSEAATASLQNQSPRIEGIPAEDGAYWYYKLGAAWPVMVMIGTYKGERAINCQPGIQKFWYPGEFFVGPIQPPYATPAELANSRLEDWGEPMYAQAVSGGAIAGDA